MLVTLKIKIEAKILLQFEIIEFKVLEDII